MGLLGLGEFGVGWLRLVLELLGELFLNKLVYLKFFFLVFLFDFELEVFEGVIIIWFFRLRFIKIIVSRKFLEYYLNWLIIKWIRICWYKCYNKILKLRLKDCSNREVKLRILKKMRREKIFFWRWGDKGWRIFMIFRKIYVYLFCL